MEDICCTAAAEEAEADMSYANGFEVRFLTDDLFIPFCWQKAHKDIWLILVSLSDLGQLLLGRPQKSRLLRPATKPMSEKRPQAVFLIN
jgi:hypothetical protein